MIKEIDKSQIAECVNVIKRSFQTVADELGFTIENARENGCSKMKIGIVEENKVLRLWYEKHGFIHTHTKKYDFFPFICGYMEKEL